MQIIRKRNKIQAAPTLLIISAIVATAIVLRPAATAVGPVLEEITHSLGMTSTQAGLLTALPGLCFAVVGIAANTLVKRLGLVTVILLASLAIVLGSLVRVVGGTWTLFLIWSIVALAGMALGNVALPAYIKAEFPTRSAGMATLYTTCLALGSVTPTFLSQPLARLAGSALKVDEGWRVALGIWVLVALVAAGCWMLIKLRTPRAGSTSVFPAKKTVNSVSLLKSPTAVALMVFFGTQSMQAYIQFGWAAQIFRDGGLNAITASLLLSIIAFGGIPGGFIMPKIVAKGGIILKFSIVVLSTCLLVGYLGMAFLPLHFPWLWATCLSISGFCFPTALALIIERTDSPEVTIAVSGFVQPVGYLFAAAGPFLVGFAFERLHSWLPILLVLAATSIIMGTSGLLASRPHKIDSEI